MPPFIPQKRRKLNSSSPDPSTPKKGQKPKPSLFDTADRPGASATLRDNKAFVDRLDDSNSDSSLSDVSSDEFEDVLASPKAKNRKTEHTEEDDEEVDWEDAIHSEEISGSKSAPEPSGDLELTLDDGGSADFSNALGKKKGPSKIERQIRVATHCMHVQFLLFHNLIRNGWACDKEIQNILVGQLPANVKKEVEKWKVASGILPEVPAIVSHQPQKRKSKKGAQIARSQRDWGHPAERQEKGVPNMSRGDPIVRLLKILAAYWKKRWVVTAPGLRKQGYKSLKALEEELTLYKTGNYNMEGHGERIENKEIFRDMARKCEGSRDAGAQLFTALIRGLGVEARLVASLQPVGFGWSKGEEASTVKKNTPRKADIGGNGISSSDEEPDSGFELSRVKGPSKKVKNRKRAAKGAKDAPIDLSEESSDDHDEEEESDDDASLIDVTPATPRRKPNMNYDRDIVFPTYWTESISPITNEVYPVDPFFLNPPIATNQEHLTLFESRGAKADKAKQVFAYIVGYSPDGTAKDVTTRYLKRHMWPGRTKGVRMPIEKVPVYNYRGKIKRYEDYDWFKTVMSGYSRTDTLRTAVDDLEETKDLKPVKPEKKESKAGEDTLQGYKNSAEFVLERHLRREEAIKPGSKPVKIFTTGKGDKAKEEDVWLRKDVEVCRTGESWHKEGRIIKTGEVPMKMVPIRAVTLTRKREIEEVERDTGEKLKQGLYAWNQTEWIIPPPIENGVIPKNAYGNIDCFVPTMVPKGAVHIPLRSTKRICTRLNIDYAEAVTGFEFGNKRAVPVIEGVVVAEENEKAIIDQWEKDEEERKIKEEGKREKAALATWRKWLMGLRIIQRVRDEYGGDADAHLKEGINPFTNQNKTKKTPQVNEEPELLSSKKAVELPNDDDMGGGFFVDGDMNGGGFFPEGHEEEEAPINNAELTIEHEEPTKSIPPPPKPPESNVDDKDIYLSGDSGSDEIQPTKSKASKPTINRTTSKKAKPTPTPKSSTTPTNKPPRSTKSLTTNSRKRKASASPPATDSIIPSSKKGTKTVPERRRGRPRKTPVRSQYFEHDSDNSEESKHSDVSGGEDEVVSRSATKRNGKVDADRRRSSRLQKGA
ncbi:hypothetical protein ACLMJK_005048 [Lecanora helva]